VFQAYQSLDKNEWHTDSVLTFNYSILDTTKKYNLSLKVRHSVDYEYENLFLFLGGTHQDTIEITLSNKEGKWMGSGISNIREFKYIFDEKKQFINKGNYKLDVEQAMRYGAEEKIKVLHHILGLGLIISENNE
tara:strand:+ start:213 stop:614 length:402 start_codon:yes stop_codon:yes gene_type:complete